MREIARAISLFEELIRREADDRDDGLRSEFNEIIKVVEKEMNRMQNEIDLIKQVVIGMSNALKGDEYVGEKEGGDVSISADIGNSAGDARKDMGQQGEHANDNRTET